MALAYRAGAALKDMEFVQFHPSTLKNTGILITEGARGEGGYLLNTLGERFMKHYAPEQMELATRSTVSLAIGQEIAEGRGVDSCVLLDLRHLGRARILERLPQIRQLSIDFAGVDPIESPIPIRPGAHYQMGGVSTNQWTETDMPGLYAAGECACVSIHGANRLGAIHCWKRWSSAVGPASELPSTWRPLKREHHQRHSSVMSRLAFKD